MDYSALSIIKIMNKFVKKLLRKFKNFKKNHRSNVNILIECVAIIMIWRGVWDLLEMYRSGALHSLRHECLGSPAEALRPDGAPLLP